MVQIKLSNTAIIAIILLLTGILTLVISYLVHKDSLAQGFKGGFWAGFTFIILGVIVVAFIAATCASNGSEVSTGNVEVAVE